MCAKNDHDQQGEHNSPDSDNCKHLHGSSQMGGNECDLCTTTGSESSVFYGLDNESHLNFQYYWESRWSIIGNTSDSIDNNWNFESESQLG